MEVSFGAYAMCPPKKLIKKTDPPEVKRLIAENIRSVKKLVQHEILQPYVNGDTFIFSRKGRGRHTAFLLEVKSNSGNLKPWILFGTSGDLKYLGKKGFINAIMTHLCFKEDVNIGNDEWIVAFLKHIKNKKTQTITKKVITEQPKKFELLRIPQPKQEKIPKPETKAQRTKRINNMTVAEAECEYFGCTIFGLTNITWREFMKKLKKENAARALTPEIKPKRTRRIKKD